jgi:DNA-binding NarL/FixJ family response regulator
VNTKASDTPLPRLLIVDDHALFARGIALLVEQALGWPCVLAARVDEAEQRLQEARAAGAPVTLVLLDLELPGLSGLEGLTRLRGLDPGLAIVVCSAHGAELARRRALDRGARAYVSKGESPDELLAVLRAAARAAAAGAARPVPAGAPDAAADAGPDLSPRQRDVLWLLAEGKSNKVIARALGMAENTVRNHVAALLDRLGVANRHEAAAAALRLGLLDPPAR